MICVFTPTGMEGLHGIILHRDGAQYHVLRRLSRVYCGLENTRGVKSKERVSQRRGYGEILR